ncbi:MAG: erythromycin esterase family protein [Halobacteriales archaeon]
MSESSPAVRFARLAGSLESNLPETMVLYDYVVHGDGDPWEALANLSSRVWQVESVLSIIEWLRAFNADPPLDDRVAFYGFGGHHTHGAVERLRDHLGAIDPALLAVVADDLAAVDHAVQLPNEVDVVHEWVATAERVVSTIREHLDECRVAHFGWTFQ